MDRVLKDFGDLMFREEEEQTVHFIYPGVRKFLFSEAATMDATPFNESNLEKQLDLLCMTYLNFDCFQRQIAEMKPTPGSKIDTMGFTKVTLPDDSLCKKITLLLLCAGHKNKSDATLTL